MSERRRPSQQPGGGASFLITNSRTKEQEQGPNVSDIDSSASNHKNAH